MLSRRLEKIIWGEDKSAFGMASRMLLYPVSACYGAIGRLRAKLFEHGVIPSYRAPVTVISVGNLTLGGTGKTPLVIELAKLSLEQGWKPVVVTRGYKGKATSQVKIVSDNDDADIVGDEPLLMAKTLKFVPIIKSASREDGMKLALEKFTPTLFILDDAFSHLQVKRDIDIVIVDSYRGFDNRKVFPAGPLREPLSALKRAHIIALRRDKPDDLSNYKKLEEEILKWAPKARVLKVVVTMDGIFYNDERIPATEVKEKKFLLFSGIANPASFDSLANSAGLTVTEHISYPDHHRYTKNDITSIINTAKKIGAHALLTTEKDAIKLDRKFFEQTPLFVARLKLEVEEKEWLIELIKSKISENLST
jgi:tetraacyldisaccharide 4'-kinase